MRRPSFALPFVAVALAFACKTASTEKSPAAAQPAGKSAAGLDSSTQVATVDGQPVTYGDVEKAQKDLAGQVKQKEATFQNEVYELRKSALDNYIAKKLIEGEAKKSNKSSEEFLQGYMDANVKKPEEAQMKALFEESKERLPPGATFEQFKPQIEQFLMQNPQREAFGKLVDKLKAEHQVKTNMPAPEPVRTEVAASGPSKGPQNAKVTIVEFSDFECPYCGREIPVVERIMKEYDGKVRLVFRHFPLSFHPHAEKAAEAAACAQDQGVDKFWSMHDKMFGNQKDLSVDDLKKYAKDSGLDTAKFDKCLTDGSKSTMVAADQHAGEEAGVNGTPAFFVDGILISGAQEFDKFKDVIDRELQSDKTYTPPTSDPKPAEQAAGSGASGSTGAGGASGGK